MTAPPDYIASTCGYSSIDIRHACAGIDHPAGPRDRVGVTDGPPMHDGVLRHASTDISAPDYRTGNVIVTASLTTGSVRVTDGADESARLIDEILELDHTDWETTLNVGDVAFYQSKNSGPFPNHQFRVSVRPGSGFAALNYMDHDDPDMPIANSWNQHGPIPDVLLIFNGSTGSVFPRSAAIPIVDARRALLEWIQTRRRPTCIPWQPYDAY
jgi:hypothetical protein